MNAASRPASRVSYPSDMSDEPWGLIADLVPTPNPHPNFPKAICARRELGCGILYFLRTICQWRHLPRDLPKWQRVASYCDKWTERQCAIWSRCIRYPLLVNGCSNGVWQCSPPFVGEAKVFARPMVSGLYLLKRLDCMVRPHELPNVHQA
jgi:hypothetical protein